jgi:hypothetical protein
VLRALGAAVVCAAAAWGALALWFKFPVGRAGAVFAWLLACAASIVALCSGRGIFGIALFALAFGMLLAWWMRLRPSNDRDWNDDVAQMTTGDVAGDLLTIRNLRDFHWRSRSDCDARWTTQTFDLRRLCSLDMILSYWAGPSIAHTLVSFGFDDAPAGVAHVVFTVEIRRRRGQLFSEIGGFFKMYELSIVAATERDAVRVRTNVRGEDDYLYRVRMDPTQRRSLLLAYVDAANRLVAAPRFYNTVTANCTTIIYQMVRRIVGHLPLSPRLLLSGYLPEYVHALGGLDTRHSVDELRAFGRCTARARAAADGADFSAAIRAGIPPLD